MARKKKQLNVSDSGPVYLTELSQIIADLGEAGLTEWQAKLVEVRKSLPSAIANARVVIAHREQIIQQARETERLAHQKAQEKYIELKERLSSFMMSDSTVLAAKREAHNIIENAKAQADKIIEQAEKDAGSDVSRFGSS